MPDTIRPRLTGLDLPGVIDLSQGAASVQLSATATDAGGVREVVLWFDRELFTPSSTYDFVGLWGIGDSWSDGRSAVSLDVLSRNAPGSINVTRVEVEDLAGNVATYSTKDLRDLGFDTSMTVVGSVADTIAPRLTALDLPDVVDLSAGNATFGISASTTDTGGIRNVVVWLDREVARTFGEYDLLGIFGHEDSWDDRRSVESITLTDATPAGIYDVTHVTVEDLYGNVTTYHNDDLRRLGFDTQMTVTGSAPAPTPSTFATLSVPDTLILREGGGANINLGFMGLTNHYVRWSAQTSTAGGTATGADLGAFSAQGSLSVVSTSPTSRSTGFTLSAIRDGIREDTETAYLTVELDGNLRFQDGGSMKVIEVRILDDNLITGTSRADVLRGTSGVDTLTGGAGNDAYHVTAGDIITEVADGGVDTVHSDHTWGLWSNIENLVLTGSAAANGTGNVLDNRLTGNAGANVLNGWRGNDTLVGGAGNDTYMTDGGDMIIEAVNGGIDTIRSTATHVLAASGENLALTGSVGINGTGNALNNWIGGNGAANVLDGVGGRDTLVGGGGNDTYMTDGGDIIREAANGGIDTVRSSATHALAANVEYLALTGTAALNGTGNALDNWIGGNAAANWLNGVTGADTLVGGAGNDTYMTEGGDIIRETAGGGIDTVRSTVTHALAANVENLVLTGTSAVNGMGNALGNVLTGNAAANVLNGWTGNDALSGGAGNDTLMGGAGADRLVGGAGRDVLRSGTGDGATDVFVFNHASETGVGAARDILFDFEAGIDGIDLRGIDADQRTAGDQAFAFGGASARANAVWVGAVEGGALVRGDVNGDRMADFEIMLSGVKQIGAGDFLL